jgi:acyl-CoA thioester hydrolase
MPSPIEVARHRIAYADCNPRRVMHYEACFRLFEIGRAELFRKLGHPFPEYIERGEYLAVFEAECRYHKPILFDDEVVIRAGAGEVGRVWVRIDYEIADAAGELRASGFTSLAAVDERGKVQRIPIAARDALRHGLA